MNRKTAIYTAVAVAFMLLAIGFLNEAKAQETQLTYCQNNRGEVVIVSNFTCPPGYWRIN